MTHLEDKLQAIRGMVSRHGFMMTTHADEEARGESISVLDVREAIKNGEIIEDYPAHRRGPCCLIYARLSSGRDVHLVVTTEKTPLRVITVYEPGSAYWVTPRQRKRGR